MLPENRPHTKQKRPLYQTKRREGRKQAEKINTLEANNRKCDTQTKVLNTGMRTEGGTAGPATSTRGCHGGKNKNRNKNKNREGGREGTKGGKVRGRRELS